MNYKNMIGGNKLPKVSVIIPVYNVEKYVKRCIESIINQTLKDIEIIIVDDGSTDNSLYIVEEYANNDSRIKLYSKKNEGLGLTRNFGITRSTGEYIAFLDSDDFVEKDFLERLYNLARKNDADICFGETKKFFNSTGKIYDFEIFNKNPNMELSSKEILYSIFNVKNVYNFHLNMSVWRAIYKKDIIDKNNIKFLSEREVLSEDIFFNFDFLENSLKKPVFCTGTYYYYCFNDTSLTNTYRADRFEKSVIFRERLIEKAIRYNEYNKLKSYIDDFFIGYTRFAIKQEIRNSKKGILQIYNVVDKILNNEIVEEALKSKNKEDWKRNFFDFLLRHKLKMLIIFIYKIHS